MPALLFLAIGVAVIATRINQARVPRRDPA